MGRKRIDINSVRITKSIRVKKSLWHALEKERIKLNHKYITNTLEHILEKELMKK